MCVLIIMGSYDEVISEIKGPCLLMCAKPVGTQQAEIKMGVTDWFYALIECLRKVWSNVDCHTCFSS